MTVAQMSVDTADALAELEPELAEAACVAAAVLALHYVTHDDTPAVAVFSNNGPAYTIAVRVDLTESFGTLIERVTQSAGSARPSLGVIVFGREPQVPGARLCLSVTGAEVDHAHDGSPGAELDAETLASICCVVLDEGMRVPGRPLQAHELLGGADRHRVLVEELLGRTGAQVKIRFDLGEIESVLLDAPGVTECAVLVDYPAPALPVLRAAVSGSPELTARQLREHAILRLPPYMLPAAVHLFPRLPRTPSGELDRRSLASHVYVEEHGIPL